MRRGYRWLLAGLGLALAFGLGLAAGRVGEGVGRPDETSTELRVARLGAAPVPRPLYEFTGENRPARGPAEAQVTVVEFTDYQCPFCRRHFEKTYPPLMREYGDRIRYIVRNFPIAQLHPQAAKVAEAAECAFDQNRFWEYHDRLFAGDSDLDSRTLKAYAEEVGLDGARFQRCLDSGEKAGIVTSDIEDGKRFGVRGTPTFFINGRILVGAQPFSVFSDQIERAFREAAGRE